MIDAWSLLLLSISLLAVTLGPYGLISVVGLLAYLSGWRRNPPAPSGANPKGHLFVRYVTRGDNPDLVRNNVTVVGSVLHHRLGPDGCTIEIASDAAIGCDAVEYVVPEDYETPEGSLFKARALCYAITQSPARDNDWILHLDEESVFDDGALDAIISIALRAEADDDFLDWIAQGAIAYGRLRNRNPLTTSIDSIRVAIDLGPSRFAAKLLNVFLVAKGSFLLVSQATERKLGWDIPPELSLTEDDAVAARYPGNLRGRWIDAFLYEGSPETLLDLMKQRRRWHHGQKSVLSSPKVSLTCKTQYLLMFLHDWNIFPVWLLAWLFLMDKPIDPVAFDAVVLLLACQAFCYAVGAFFNYRGTMRRLVMAILCALMSPVFLSLALIVWIWALATSPGNQFQVVRKRPLTEG